MKGTTRSPRFLSMTPTPVLILGSGFIAEIHLESYHRFVPEAEVVAVYTRDPEKGKQFAEKHGIPAHLIDGADDIRAEWLAGKSKVGVTAGASAPESLVREVIARLQAAGAASVRELEGEPENMVFALPKALRAVVVD